MVVFYASSNRGFPVWPSGPDPPERPDPVRSFKHHRWLLVGLVTASQLFCLLLATVLLTSWLEERMARFFADHLPRVPGAYAVAIDQLITQVQVTGHIWAALVASLTGIVTWVIVRRYDVRLAAIHARLEKMVEDRTRSLVKTRDATIFGLAKLAEWRDDDTGMHLDRIRSYVETLSHALEEVHPELTSHFITELGVASSLHDIGKVGIPDAILQKPGRLTPEERETIEKHTLIGGNCLMAIKERLGQDDFLQLACDIALCHHEQWGGTGYPYGLSGNDIPLGARIVALADVYDALTCERVYKKAMSHEKAREIILEKRGTHFDPDVVDAFVRAEEEFIAIAKKGSADFSMRRELELEHVS